MRIATYNVEWFNSLFDDRGSLLMDDRRSGRYGITRAQQAEALGVVFTALNADAIMVIEAPDQSSRRATVPALESFAQAFDLRAHKVLMGFENNTQQEIALLYDPAALTVRHDPWGNETGKKGSPTAPRFDSVFRIDLDIDATEDLVRFSKPPLEIAAKTALGFEFRMTGVHLKSKAPHGARTKEEAMRFSIQNRRKQLAQAIWLRQRIEENLALNVPLMVMGDLNDGPGLDEYEGLFGRSTIEIVMGEGRDVQLHDPHARQALATRLGAKPTSARFYIAPQKRYLQALLDYIMISPDLSDLAPEWRIWHPFDDPGCWQVPELRDALIFASDHFPVTLDIAI
jgi:hypothetical protein